MRFVIDIENPESIDKVYVSSNKNGDKKYIEAIYDEESGKYIAEGYFEPTNVSYVPGVLNVEYLRKEVSYSEYFDAISELFTSEEIPEGYPKELLSSKYDVVKESDNYYEAEITLGEELGEFENDKFKITIAELNTEYSGNLTDHIIVKDDKGNQYKISFDRSDLLKTAVVVQDIASSKTFELILEFFDDPTIYNDLDVVLESLDLITGISGYVVEQFEIEADHDKLVDKIYETSDASELYGKLEAAKQLKKDKQGFSLAFTLLSLAPMLAVPFAGPIMGTATAMFSLLMVAFNTLGGLAFDMRENKILYGSSGFNLGWLMDPSGFVYEATENNRLEGVTATIYYQDPETGKAVKWNAEEYDQVNPQITDDAGQYAWDVLEGMWQVKFEKEGYETTYSEWLPVPPPQLDVNIAMTTTEDPEVVDVIIDGNTATVEFNQYVDIATVNTSNCIVKIGNNTANGSWNAVDAETYVKDENKQIAKKFIFTANKNFGDNYSISISNIVNYAGITMKETYNKTAVPAVHEHNYTATTVPSSCTINGSVAYNCALLI